MHAFAGWCITVSHFSYARLCFCCSCFTVGVFSLITDQEALGTVEVGSHFILNNLELSMIKVWSGSYCTVK